MSLNQICHDDEKYFLWKNRIHIKQYANKFAYSYLVFVLRIKMTTTMQATIRMTDNTIRAVIHGCNPQSGQVHVKPSILLIQVYESGHGEGLCVHSSTSSSQCSPVNSGVHTQS